MPQFGSCQSTRVAGLPHKQIFFISEARKRLTHNNEVAQEELEEPGLGATKSGRLWPYLQFAHLGWKRAIANMETDQNICSPKQKNGKQEAVICLR